MAKREFLMLAHNYESDKYGIANWFMSDKLDGQRALWDGGITRGKFADEVPFANTEKDGRLLNRRRATGLWSRYGKPIHAPDWWLDKLPPCSLDGELYAGLNSFQELMSTVKDLTPGPGWQGVRYHAFDKPPLSTVLDDGVINNTGFKKTFRGVAPALGLQRLFPIPFEVAYDRLVALPQNDVFVVHYQERLPHTTASAVTRVEERLAEVTAAGGEGLMLRAPHSIWTAERVRTLLKVKRLQDMEGEVTGYTWGRKTELGSKLLGLMGALVLKLDSGVRLELSGFTDAEREMCVTGGGEWAESFGAARKIGELHPGEPVVQNVHNPTFPIGSKVTFRYRELTDTGVPKEARYWRRST